MRILNLALKFKSTQSFIKTLLFGLSVCLCHTGLVAQNNYVPEAVGSVNFTLGSTSLKPSMKQTVSLYGCNTRITINGKNWNASDSLEWGKANQVLDSVPFGPQIDTETQKPFYISKYYIAAPPVIRDAVFNIGKVIPDYFSLDAENQKQSVYFDYTRVINTQVKMVKVTFDSSFINTGINILPINIECKDFPWIDSTQANEIGASGIGDLQMSKTANFSGLFLPYYYNDSTHTDSTFLNCEITILKDIIPHHKVEFEINGDKTNRMTTINLTKFQNDSITLVSSGIKTKMPCGCKKPEPEKACD